MKLFQNITSFYKKTNATIVVQNLLTIQVENGQFDADPALSARILVDQVWNKSPHLFDGRFGQRPHKISIAAAAFSNAIQDQEVGRLNKSSFAICLGKVLDNVAVNGKLYPLNNLDMEHLDTASRIYASVTEEILASPLAQEIDSLMEKADGSWDAWFSEYKRSAGEHNSGLAPMNGGGVSLIDLMDEEPMRRAHRDGINPTSLGKELAENFDPTKMDVA
ncbi:MAG: hypothetical protein P8P35_16770 [Planktotalea sp.]|uniref:hypothetical protein n=1 Tax=Planktotalea sp. TaxID=2029877 RepID=UPI002606DC9A|nr:hypothetical protein [Planktotalea sp.]MDG1085728.1 hypothetical protein [Planktotalea sp.]